MRSFFGVMPLTPQSKAGAWVSFTGFFERKRLRNSPELVMAEAERRWEGNLRRVLGRCSPVFGSPVFEGGRAHDRLPPPVERLFS